MLSAVAKPGRDATRQVNDRVPMEKRKKFRPSAVIKSLTRMENVV